MSALLLPDSLSVLVTAVIWEPDNSRSCQEQFSSEDQRITDNLNNWSEHHPRSFFSCISTHNLNWVTQKACFAWETKNLSPPPHCHFSLQDSIKSQKLVPNTAWLEFVVARKQCVKLCKITLIQSITNTHWICLPMEKVKPVFLVHGKDLRYFPSRLQSHNCGPFVRVLFPCSSRPIGNEIMGKQLVQSSFPAN